MRAGKRRWLYAGIALPRGMALVRRPSLERARAPAQRVLLAGGAVASGIGPALKRLARDAKVPMVLRVRSGGPWRWLERGWLLSELRAVRPSVLLLAMEPGDASQGMEALAKRHGASAFWLPLSNPGAVSVRALPASSLNLPLGPDKHTPNAAGYAAWAAAVWRVIN